MEPGNKEEFRTPYRLTGMQKSNIRQIFDSAKQGSINFGLGQFDLALLNAITDEAGRVIVGIPPDDRASIGTKRKEFRRSWRII